VTKDDDLAAIRDKQRGDQPDEVDLPLPFGPSTPKISPPDRQADAVEGRRLAIAVPVRVRALPQRQAGAVSAERLDRRSNVESH
jgi:hypothetical protein